MLNVLTPKGQKAEAEAREAILKLCTAETRFAWFPENNYYPIDGFRIEGSAITGIFEGKVRQAGYRDGAIEYNGRLYDDYLITAQKLDQGIEMAKQMRTDFLLYVLLSHTAHILCFTIYKASTNQALPFKRRTTKTQAGVNGGEAVRENAFLEIRGAEVIKI